MSNRQVSLSEGGRNEVDGKQTSCKERSGIQVKISYQQCSYRPHLFYRFFYYTLSSNFMIIFNFRLEKSVGRKGDAPLALLGPLPWTSGVYLLCIVVIKSTFMAYMERKHNYAL